MKNDSLTLTIVIPVFNEERYLAACLAAIKKQTVKPDEVIVVNNNSTDRSVEIARQFDFVHIIDEPRQHQSFAQAAGFNAAGSDILGRVDADSILPPDWVKRIKEAFADEHIVAVTGGADPYDVPLRWVGIAIFNGYTFLVRLIVGHRVLWGANCAVRKSGWKKIKNTVLLRPDIWEDYDLSFCLARYGVIKYIRGLRAGVSFRSMHTSFSRHVSYQFRSLRTFYYRASVWQLILYTPLWLTTFLVYPLSAFDDWLLSRRRG